MFPWWLRTKRFGFQPSFQDEARWAKQGNVYTLRKPDHEQDKWVTPAFFSTKAVGKLSPNERLEISGTANANIIDRVQERLDPRGLDATDYLRNPQLLAHHSYYCPVGQVEILDIQDDGVHFGGWVGDPERVGGTQFLTEIQQDIRSLIAQRILKTVSVGFIPHKFRAPVYNDNGDMEEPLVIESWELLELSIVAVPANQLSLFEMREHQNENQRFYSLPLNNKLQEVLKTGGKNVTKEDIIVELQNVFSNLKFSSGEESVATKPVANASMPKNGSKATVDSSSNSEDNTDNSEDNNDDNFKKEAITLLRTMNAGQQKTIELCNEMLKRMMGDNEETDGSEDTEEENKEVEALSKRIDMLEAGQKEIAIAIKAIAVKLG